MTKNLIIRKESTRYPGLFTVKYHNRVFYDNLWTDELLESRGRVELSDGTVVVNPFTKIFNRNENGTNINGLENCIAVEKINGFMAASTYVKHVDEVVVSTTGSLDSDFVFLAEEYITPDIKKKIKDYYKGMTILFEICHPKDPHIIEEKPGAYLIGARKVHQTESYFSTFTSEQTLNWIAKELGVMRPKCILSEFWFLIENLKSLTTEGYIVYGQESGTVLKLKSPYYLSAKAIARIKDISKLKKEFIDEEFYTLIEFILKNKSDFEKLQEQEKLQIIRKFYGI